MAWWGWCVFGVALLGVELFAVDAQFYLVFLGVRPEHQGKGLGSKLLEHTLSGLDEVGIPAYLENSNKDNMPLYESHGFKLYDEFKLNKGSISEWCMWRKPKTLIG